MRAADTSVWATATRKTGVPGFRKRNLCVCVCAEYERKIIIICRSRSYVTAFKGNNKGKGIDDITYGAIFDDCDFTAEEFHTANPTAVSLTFNVAVESVV